MQVGEHTTKKDIHSLIKRNLVRAITIQYYKIIQLYIIQGSICNVCRVESRVKNKYYLHNRLKFYMRILSIKLQLGVKIRIS